MKHWTPKTPYLATDGIIEVYDQGGSFEGIVLIERKNTPTGLAFPGGFVEVGESVEDALKREMKEETALEVSITKLLGVYSDPQRDKRFHTVSIVFLCRATGVPRGGDDAKEAYVYALDKVPKDTLVFDHQKIFEDYMRQRAGTQEHDTLPIA